MKRNDVINLVKLENDKLQFKKYFEENVLRNWNSSKENNSDRRNEVFMNFIFLLYQEMEKKQYSLEQRSTILSIAYYIFTESLDKKLT